jgi:hypothetical protein
MTHGLEITTAQLVYGFLILLAVASIGAIGFVWLYTFNEKKNDKKFCNGLNLKP